MSCLNDERRLLSIKFFLAMMTTNLLRLLGWCWLVGHDELSVRLIFLFCHQGPGDNRAHFMYKGSFALAFCHVQSQGEKYGGKFNVLHIVMFTKDTATLKNLIPWHPAKGFPYEEKESLNKITTQI